MLPHGTGKALRVAVFAEGEKAKEAEAAGADFVGAADLAAKIEGGFDDFDVAIATPDLNARDVEAAMKVIAGTARSMGVEVES